MSIKRIDIGKEFYHRLLYRDKKHGVGIYTGEEFREKYLSFLDNKEMWRTPNTEIELDFSNVSKIGPSFANEVFAYFTKYTDPKTIQMKIKLINISKLDQEVIETELDYGYRPRKR